MRDRKHMLQGSDWSEQAVVTLERRERVMMLMGVLLDLQVLLGASSAVVKMSLAMLAFHIGVPGF